MPDPSRLVWAVPLNPNPMLHAHIPSADSKAVCGERHMFARGYTLCRYINLNEAAVKLCKKCWPR